MLHHAWRSALTLHRWLYTSGLRSQTELPSPTIVLGAMRAGGSGKTPAARWLAHRAYTHGATVIVLSSGYIPRKRPTPPRIIFDSSHTTPTTPHALEQLASTHGDEAAETKFLLTQTIHNTPQPPGRLIWIAGRDRLRAFKLGHHHLGALPDRIILDDGLHHHPIKLKPSDTKIAMVGPGDAQSRLLPLGPLREDTTLLKRVHHQWHHDAASDPHHNTTAPINSHWSSTPQHTPPALLFSATGAPHRILASARRNGVDVRKFIALPDHYAYPTRKLSDLIALCQRHHLTPVTTRKDHVKFAARWPLLAPKLNVTVLGGHLEVTSGIDVLDMLLTSNTQG